MKRGECVLLFPSVHDVMAFDRLLRRQAGAAGAAGQRPRVRHDMVPTPRELSSDCGMAITLPCKDVAAAVSLAAGRACAPQAAYRLTDGGFERQDMAP